MEKNKPKLVFIHLQKTGGNTFVDLLKQNIYNEEDIYFDKTDVLNLEEHVVIGVSPKNNIIVNYQNQPFICGHVRASKYKYSNIKMITWVRDPVERIISHYYYYRQKINSGREKLHETVERLYTDCTLYDFCEIYNNYMSKIINCGLSNFKFIGIVENYEESLKQFEKIFEVDLGERLEPKNVNPKKPIVSEYDKEQMRKYFEKDYKLYEKALKRHEKFK